MQIDYTADFIKSLKKLPKEIQKKAIEQEDIFKLNPNDARLHTKPLQGRLKGICSFRVTRNYRVLYAWVKKNQAIFYEIGDRKWIYR